MSDLVTFCQHPSYPLLVSIIRSIDADPSYQKNRDTYTPTIGFFAVAFERYPDQFNSLSALTDSLRNMKKIIRDALRLSRTKDAILNWQEHKPVTIDILWYGYFASREPKYLKRIVSQMILCERNDSIYVTFTGLRAEYSLCINARVFPEVKQYLEEALGTAPASLLPYIREALYSQPIQIYQQMRDRAEQFDNRQK